MTAGQQTNFGKSQERDADGNLRVMYRGDSEEVTVYDRKKSKPSNLYGRGFYCTSEKSHAGQYGIVRAFYLNTVDPLMQGQHKITKDQMLRFLEAVENDGEDYDLYNYGEGATAQSVLETVWGKGDFEMLQDVSASAVGDLVAAVELFNEINGTTYDSIRLPAETVIFNSNQAKLTTNKNPTDHPDIRYRLAAGPYLSVRTLLTDPTVEGKNDAQKLNLQRYRDSVAKADGLEAHLKDVEAQYKEMPTEQKKSAEGKELRAEINKTKNRLNMANEAVQRLEQSRPLQELLPELQENAKARYKEDVKAALAEMEAEYGTIPAGEKAVRDDSHSKQYIVVCVDFIPQNGYNKLDI